MAGKQTKTVKTKLNNAVNDEDVKKSFGAKMKNFFGLNKAKPVDLPTKQSANPNKAVNKPSTDSNNKPIKEKKSLCNKVKNWFHRKKSDETCATAPAKNTASVPTAKSTEQIIEQLRDDLEMERKKRIDETRKLKHYQSLSEAKDELIEKLNKDFELERKRLLTERNQRVSAQIESIKQLRKHLATEKTLTKTLKDKLSVAENELHDVACKYIMDTSITAQLKNTQQDLLKIKNTK